jgi:hypothetical protein
MIVECSNCGAPLDVGARDRLVTCRYCDKTNRVRKLKTLAMKTPPSFQPPPVQAPPAFGRAPSAKPLEYHVGAKHQLTKAANKASGRGGCSVFFFVLLSIGVGFLPMMSEIPFSAIPFLADIPGLPGLKTNQPPSLAMVAVDAQPKGDWPGSATGEIDVGSYGPSCRGHVPEVPHLTLTLTRPHEMSLTTQASEDLVMMVRGADQSTRCDDDSGESQQPRISEVFAPGTYYVWVGVFSQSTVVPFTLSMEASPMDVMPDADGLASAAPPTLGRLDFSSPDGASAAPLAGAVTGLVQAPGSACQGHLQRVPHLAVRTTVGTALRITATSSTDLTLLARSPTGASFCDDDSGDGTNPMLQLPAAAGDHLIWVGSFHQGTLADFQLVVTPLAASGRGPHGPKPD